LGLVEAIERLGDLEYSAVAIDISDGSQQISPDVVAGNLEKAIGVCRDTHRMDLAGYSVEIRATGAQHYEIFAAICKLAKATKVASVTVPSAELGTPFNEEVEHLRRLVNMATVEGVLVSMRTQVGRLSQDPDTIKVMCDNVKGLGVTLDPSAFIYNSVARKGYESLLPYVYATELRDTSDEAFQVRVGRGNVDYSKLVTYLSRSDYRRALCVKMNELEGIDHNSEMRKIRLLLESLL
jgi:sugar phosphate isomerase/epimerase